MKILSPEWRRRAYHHQHIDGGPAVPEGVQLDLWVFADNPLDPAPLGEIKRSTAMLTAGKGDHAVAVNATAAMIRADLMGYLAEQAIEQLQAQIEEASA